MNLSPSARISWIRAGPPPSWRAERAMGGASLDARGARQVYVHARSVFLLLDEAGVRLGHSDGKQPGSA
eukprot:5863341-Pyramimonas_sp.AAC.1